MNSHVPQRDFDKFVDNDFKHLSNMVQKLSGTVQQIEKTLSFVRGEIAVVGPLILALLGIVLTIILKH